ncbi:PD40 domain-containing protein [Nonomuraea sp. K274]|uniref:PD40 domain-containing protein n=1 Tax=Nonomuraea cypriaca TaxID=1187855 RepID=A0A931ABL9_9ACTN|nr:WD40 repeat domain-containing protein [Nonomuraea cypriaca]MBF8189972.1 PD40 domain-containing protein [Nonomuraea cypriaca]
MLRDIGAVGVAVEAAIESGDRRLQEALAAGLARLGEEFGEFGFVLAEVRGQLGVIREGIDRQGDRLRRQGAELHAELRVAVDLGYRQATDTRLLLEQVAAIERRTRTGSASPGETGRSWSGECPYRGLVAFSEADAGVFYGREVVTAQLVARLAQRLTGPGLLVVTGASGAGKSSLLRAGVMPAIGRGELSEQARDWPRHVLDRPTGAPLSRLATFLAGLAALEAPAVLRSLTEQPGQAHLLVRQAVEADARRRGLPEPSAAGSRLVLVVDQFEEIFTLDVPEDERERAMAERAAFITALHAAASVAIGPDDAPAALVVLVVRGDFIDRCAEHPRLAAVLQDGPFVLGPMPGSDLRRAITGPADAAGLDIEPGLIDTILNELRSPAGGYEAGVLPLLSQTMLTIWEHREDNRLTSRGYALTGGVTQAVATSAEAAYADLTPGRQALARLVFHQLTAVSTEGRLTRRATSRQALHAGRGEDGIDHVLDTFAARRLIVVDGASVQIAHDVLLHAWPRLYGWLEADLTGHALYHQFVEAAQEWEEHERSPSFLFRGERLSAVQHAQARWQADPGRYPALSAASRAFLDAGVRAQTSGRRRQRATLVTLTALLVAAVVFAGVALRSSIAAGEERDQALAGYLISRSELAAADPAFSALLAAAAWRIAPDRADARARLTEILRGSERGILPDLAGPIWAVAFSADGKTLATGGYDRTVRLWDLSTGGPLGEPLTGHTSIADSMAFSPDGKTLATGSIEGAVRLWDVSTGRPLGEVLTGDTPSSVAFSPDGKNLAIAYNDDGTVRLWDISTGRRLGKPFTGHSGPIRSVAFSPDGSTLASAGDDGTVRLWGAAEHRPLGDPLTGHTGPVWSVAFSPDGNTLATGNNDGTVQLWNLAPPSDLYAAVCAIPGRALTREEWEEHAPGQRFRPVCS